MLPGACRHTTESEVCIEATGATADAAQAIIESLPRLLAQDNIPTRPQLADGGASLTVASSPAGAAEEVGGTLPPRVFAKRFKKRVVSVARAGGIDALAVTFGFPNVQFSILAPTMGELEWAWAAIERGQGARHSAIDERSVQKVCIVDQAEAKDVP